MLIHLRIRHLTFSRNVTRKYFTLRTCFRTIHFPKYRHISKILTFKRTNSWRQNFQGKNASENFVFVNSRFEKFVLKTWNFSMRKVTKTPICINEGPFGRRCFGGVMTTVSSSELSSLPWKSGWLPPRGQVIDIPRSEAASLLSSPGTWVEGGLSRGVQASEVRVASTTRHRYATALCTRTRSPMALLTVDDSSRFSRSFRQLDSPFPLTVGEGGGC